MIKKAMLQFCRNNRTPYGDNYIISATDRTISSALRDDDYNGIITWNNKTKDLVYSEVRYKTSSGEEKIVRIQPDETILICPNIKPNEHFEYRSAFVPLQGIDTITREWRMYEKPFLYKYPRAGWSVAARNGNHPWGDGGGGEPELILDGNLATGWHSKVGSPLPQCIVVDMKQSLEIDNIIIYPPEPVNWRYLNNIEIYLSDVPINPDEPQPSGVIP